MARLARRISSGAFGIWIGLGLATGCGGDEPKKTLSDGCVQNSDCDNSLVCSFGHCHEQCSATKDCPTGSRCVRDAQGENVCQLPSERECEYNSDCATPLVCATDGECRNECKSTRDCVTGQVCASSKVCAEPSELDEDNRLPGETGGGGAGGAASSEATAGSRESGAGAAGHDGSAAGSDAGVGGAAPGDTSTAGAAHSAGAAGTGSQPSAGTGGVQSTGGAAGTGGAWSTCPTTLIGENETAIFQFFTDTEGFGLLTYEPEPPTVSVSAVSTLTWVGGIAAGCDPNGALRLEIPFNAYNQIADIQLDLGLLVDYSDRILRARVLVESGFSPDPSSPGGARVFAKTGEGWIYGQGEWKNLMPADLGTWQVLEMDVLAPEFASLTYDATQVRAIGVNIATGSGVYATDPPTPAVIYIDDVTLERK